VLKRARVNIDYHVQLDGHYYSVPHRLVGTEVELHIGSAALEVCAGTQRVALHPLSAIRGAHTTTADHMPASHRAHLEWTPAKLIAWGERIGAACAALVRWQMEHRPHPELGYRACLGLQQLARSCGAERLEAACARALSIRSPTYRSVASILASGLDRQPLRGMIAAVDDQATSSAAAELPFEDRLALLVQREIDWRDGKRLARLLKAARLKVTSACIEDILWRPARNLDRQLVASLSGCDWVRQARTVLLTGATGTGKTWLACALAQQAARCGLTVLYTRTTRLLQELRVAHGDGSFARRLTQISRIDLLVLDDFAGAPMEAAERTNLLELLDDRVGAKATVITSQLAVNAWHAWLDDPTVADAILDRIVHCSHRVALKGPSLRKQEEAAQ